MKEYLMLRCFFVLHVVHDFAQGHNQDRLVDRLSVVRFKDQTCLLEDDAFNHQATLLSECWLLERSDNRRFSFGPARASGMSEGCYCRLGGIFFLEAPSRWVGDKFY